ncbi:MAG: thiol peroxidase [Desulfobacterales bacterium]
MTQVTFKGNTVNTVGELPAEGNPAPEFNLTKTDMSDIHLSDFKGRRLVLNIFPSIETPVCSASVKRFNNDVEKLENTEVLCISRDLPFAHARFNVEQEIKNVISLSELRDSAFGENYGVRMTDGPLAGLFARAVVVVDENSKVAYTQLVPEIAEEPDYGSVLKLLGRDAGDLEFCTSSPTPSIPPNGG